MDGAQGEFCGVGGPLLELGGGAPGLGVEFHLGTWASSGSAGECRGSVVGSISSGVEASEGLWAPGRFPVQMVLYVVVLLGLWGAKSWDMGGMGERWSRRREEGEGMGLLVKDISSRFLGDCLRRLGRLESALGG